MSNIKNWIGRDYTKNMLLDAINSIKSSYNSLMHIATIDGSTKSPHSAGSNKSDNWFFSSDFDAELAKARDDTEQSQLAVSSAIDTEINHFKGLLSSADFIKTVQSSHKFWTDNGVKMPKLKKLFSITQNIPASSAFIERFFSICGCVCTVRRGRMTSGLIRCRSLLKTNIKLLNEMEFDQE